MVFRYSEKVLYTTNPSTNEPYTEEERNNKRAEYERTCLTKSKLNSTCCDPNDDRLDRVLTQIPQSIRTKYPFVKKQVENGEEIYYICRGSDCISKGFRKATAYDSGQTTSR